MSEGNDSPESFPNQSAGEVGGMVGGAVVEAAKAMIKQTATEIKKGIEEQAGLAPRSSSTQKEKMIKPVIVVTGQQEQKGNISEDTVQPKSVVAPKE